MELPVSDRLFRHAFSTPQSARELAENFLPPTYRRRIAGARVTVERSSYVDQALRDHVTDLVIRFDSPSGEQLYLYVLVDHKSQPQRWVPLQTLRYVALLFLKYLSRRIDRAAAGVLLEAMHREPLTPQLREFFQSCYRAMAARKQAEEIAVLMEAAESHSEIKGKREGRLEGRQEGISLGPLGAHGGACAPYRSPVLFSGSMGQ